MKGGALLRWSEDVGKPGRGGGGEGLQRREQAQHQPRREAVTEQGPT